MAEQQAPKLSDIFQEVFETYQWLEDCSEPTGSDTVQKKVADVTKKCELGMMMTNQLSLFSSNEDIEEVSSNEIKYMLLPALLAYLTNKNTKEDRFETVKRSQVFYVDFLKLVKDYGLTQVEIPKIYSEKSDIQKAATKNSAPGRPDISAMQSKRDQKMARFKQQKETEKRLKELFEYVKKDHVDDEVMRDYYMTLLTRWTDISMDELDSIEMELPILEHMARMKIDGRQQEPPKVEKPQPKGLLSRPFIITRNALQKQVVGAGYPSLPTFTIEEWCDMQIAQGKLPDRGDAMSMQGSSNDPAEKAAEEEKEAIAKEERQDRDDPEERQKTQEWDEYKDVHRRGWGNRQNMG